MADGKDMVRELEERLGGAYDLDASDDCRAIIGLLMRDLDEANVRERETNGSLKTLSLMVMNMNPAMRKEAIKTLEVTIDNKNKVVQLFTGGKREGAKRLRLI